MAGWKDKNNLLPWWQSELRHQTGSPLLFPDATECLMVQIISQTFYHVKINVLLKVPFKLLGKSISILPNITNMDGQICVVPVRSQLLPPPLPTSASHSLKRRGYSSYMLKFRSTNIHLPSLHRRNKNWENIFLTEQCLLSGSEKKGENTDNKI